MSKNDYTEYYLDLNYLSEFCAIKLDNLPEDENEEGEIKINPMSTGIDVFKYEIIKMCLDRILFDKEVNSMESEIMTMKRSLDDDASYRLAFNTLLAHKIIKEYE